MAKLNFNELDDPTLKAVDEAIERIGNAEPARGYLGMSSIGDPCLRKLWYQFRQCGSKPIQAKGFKAIQDGHHGEDVQAARLRLVDGLTLNTIDPITGRQYRFVDHGGHFAGHCDGKIQGLKHAPKRLAIWEHKQVNENKFEKLKNLILEHGRKQALAKWDEIYYAQAVLYMYYSGLERHYLTCATPGGRDTVAVWTEKNTPYAEQLREKALRIIEFKEPPERITDNPSWYACKFCNFHPVCFGQWTQKNCIPLVNCRTCAHSTPLTEGQAAWHCAKWKSNIPADYVSKGCPKHLFIPALIPAKPVDASEEENWVEYELPNGTHFVNGQHPMHYTSQEIRNIGSTMLESVVSDNELNQLKSAFDGRIVKSEPYVPTP
jgi:hypothetical protein